MHGTIKGADAFSAECCLVAAIRQLRPRAETIIAIRHAEKPPTSLGQLTCRGLNRALALPNVLIPRYGRPDRIYAPDPGTRIGQLGNLSYSYVRPLMTLKHLSQ